MCNAGSHIGPTAVHEAQVDYDVGPLALPCVISTVHRAQLFTLSREVITALIESSMLVL